MDLTIGITGHFCSGKSLASDFFEKRGFFKIDADAIGKIALQEKKEEIIKYFGDLILTNREIDPKKLGNIVFEKEEKLLALNQIVHPFMKQKIKEIIDQQKGNKVIDAAILEQLGLVDFCNFVIYIQVEEEKIIERAIKRNQYAEQKIKSILNIQKKYNDYLKIADVIVKNNKSLEDFYQKLEKLYKKITEDKNDTSRKRQTNDG